MQPSRLPGLNLFTRLRKGNLTLRRSAPLKYVLRRCGMWYWLLKQHGEQAFP